MACVPGPGSRISAPRQPLTILGCKLQDADGAGKKASSRGGSFQMSERHPSSKAFAPAPAQGKAAAPAPAPRPASGPSAGRSVHGRRPRRRLQRAQRGGGAVPSCLQLGSEPRQTCLTCCEPSSWPSMTWSLSDRVEPKECTLLSGAVTPGLRAFLDRRVPSTFCERQVRLGPHWGV